VFDTPHEQNRSKDGDGRLIIPTQVIKQIMSPVTTIFLMQRLLVTVIHLGKILGRLTIGTVIRLSNIFERGTEFCRMFGISTRMEFFGGTAIKSILDIGRITFEQETSVENSCN
jgi:hypothetical protein